MATNLVRIENDQEIKERLASKLGSPISHRNGGQVHYRSGNRYSKKQGDFDRSPASSVARKSGGRAGDGEIHARGDSIGRK
jgi:hypothetical protein